MKLGLEVLGLAALIVYTVFSMLQWAQIRWTNRLTREALDGSDKTLQQTLAKLQGQIEATNKLAGFAKDQADQARAMAINSGTQASATRGLVEAEREAAHTAAAELQTVQQQFQASQRPWLSLNVSAKQLVVDEHFAHIVATHFVATNVGHSIAKTVLYRSVLLSGVGSSTETGKECEYSKSERESWGQAFAGTVAFPGETVEGEDDIAVSIRRLYPGSHYTLISCIFYTSPVDELPHWTRVAYWVTPKDHHANTYNPGTYDVDLTKPLNRSTQAY